MGPEQPSPPVASTPAGWYADPQGPGQRYWDGASWTEHRTTTDAPSSPGAAAGPHGPLPAAFWVMVASVVGMVIGALGPWATALGISVSGTGNGRDGVIVLAIAVIAAILMLVHAASRRGGYLIAAAVFGALSAAACLYDVIDINNKSAQVSNLLSVGWGLYVALAGSAALVISALVTRASAR